MADNVKTVVVRAAYGRSYTTEAEVQGDWNRDRDFEIVAITPFPPKPVGRYINRADRNLYIPSAEIIVVYGDSKEVRL